MLPLLVLALTSTPAKWTVSTSAGSTQILSAKAFDLLSGWRCDVGDVSELGSRQVTCSKKSERVAFTVQCMDERRTDRAQVRLGAGAKADFIELQCES